ncbi:ABC transporter ATP-binding protein [Methanohalophilus portucalensis]|uniref:ABC transporter n=2 Tax=Methanohalophilus portucalensis TaxID=39664 RepID=A0A1L9C215_9EURY|nr:ABC transporter ATP-binding protein [Methanohalophilus portucalensis]ATU09102.1 ABC transporter ATP-binding protein [Methanohalophilus portucalensis]OJH48533.1 ABC transporter [Methanohalophilus portucalensis FDF-1]RNI12554.1 ABC transporter ATP-binding protein [Methanohalophilus portucalensis FDF-1]SMH30606.1 lipoprotein-releasing system ATP-binding protein [Methanohalophilus portucalensis FDF-1]
MPQTDNIIEIRGLEKVYGDGVEVKALDGLDLDVKKGEFLSIVGPSGSGKSTLLHMIGILDTPTKGTILIDGQDVTSMDDRQRSSARNKLLGFIFQYHHLLPDFTALENVMMPLLIAGKKKDEATREAEKLLNEVGLKDRLHHFPGQLSGGQNQRVAVARALVNKPKIVIGDEPTGNLDSHSSDKVYELLRKLNREFDQTFILVTHDENMARKTDRIVRIIDGKITE